MMHYQCHSSEYYRFENRHHIFSFIFVYTIIVKHRFDPQHNIVVEQRDAHQRLGKVIEKTQII